MTAGAVLAYGAFWLLAVVAPGVALQRLARVRIDLALVLPLGCAACALAFWATLVSGWRPLGPLLLGLVGLAGVLQRDRWEFAPGPSLRGAGLAFAAFLALLVPTQFGFNRVAGDGDFLLDPLLTYDTTFHVGLVRELALGWPPQVPGLAGFPLGYHFGLDLVRAAALTWAGSDPFDQCARFDVAWLGLALILALRGAAARLGLTAGAVSLAGFTPLLTDFAWVFALNPQAHWWADLLRGNVLLSLFLANPAVPALALALASLVALSRHSAGEGRGYLVLAASGAAALPHFKVFLGAHLLLGLGVAFVLLKTRRRSVVVMALPAAISTALLVLGQGGASVGVGFDPAGLVRDTRNTLGLDPTGTVRWLAFAVVWLLASLGARALALPACWRALRGREPLAVVLAAMALAGWPLGLLVSVAARQRIPGEAHINDAAYLVEQAGPLLWLFCAGALTGFARTRARAAVAVLLVALSLPATAHFVWKKAGLAPDRLPAGMRLAAGALADESAPGEVVLQRPAGRFPPAPVIFAGRRVPYDRFTPYLTQFGEPAALEARHEQVARFFRTRDAVEARAIAESLGARLLLLYGEDRVRFDLRNIYDVVYAANGATLYRLGDAAP